MLSNAQRLVLWLAAVTCALLGLFPPWLLTLPQRAGEVALGHSARWSPPSTNVSGVRPSVDLALLWSEIGLVMLVAGLVVLSLARR